jgi:DNA-binding HxlR family transcriptional regulator
MRAGAYGLSLLSNPLNVRVLGALANRKLDLPDLHREAGLPPQTTLRAYLRALVEIGVLYRYQEAGFPGGVSYELTDSGRDLLDAGRILEAWLASSPSRSLSLGESSAKGVVQALVDGWSTKVLRALAAKPLSLTQLDRLIPSVNYPALERRVAAMRSAGQIVAERGSSGSRPYQVTNWLRTAAGPLLAAANWEESRTPAAADPFDRLDAEAVFLLLLPLLELPAGWSGTCHLAIDLRDNHRAGVSGVLVEFDRGRATACRSPGKSSPPTQVIGSASVWMRVLNGDSKEGLEVTGQSDLANEIVDSLRRALLDYDVSRPSVR